MYFGAGQRYRNQYDHDDHGRSQRGGSCKGPDHGFLARQFLPAPARCKRKLRRYLIPDCSAVLPKRSRGKEAVDVKTLAQAFVHATETAYKAVMKRKRYDHGPVAKGMADKAVETAEGIKMTSWSSAAGSLDMVIMC